MSKIYENIVEVRLRKRVESEMLDYRKTHIFTLKEINYETRQKNSEGKRTLKRRPLIEF